jgi:hypothetical protein
MYRTFVESTKMASATEFKEEEFKELRFAYGIYKTGGNDVTVSTCDVSSFNVGLYADTSTGTLSDL